MWYANGHRQAVLDQPLARLCGWMLMVSAVVFGTQWELQRRDAQMAKAAAVAGAPSDQTDMQQRQPDSSQRGMRA
ncbi:hypothetical_protein-conserved [Leishmania major strain Friedlin]|nr:hypothetical_protein-conserved [Leishmania major strain Friedlin]